MAGGGDDEANLELTPTWIVALVCTIIVFISLVVERLIHHLGKSFKKKDQKFLFEALQKIKEELMLVGFISLLLVAFDSLILRICVPPGMYVHLLPCSKEEKAAGVKAQYRSNVFVGVLGSGRRLLAGAGENHCKPKGKVQLMSLKALHDLHVFIFVLAITHVTLSVFTMRLGTSRIKQWKHWEVAIRNDITENDPNKLTHVQNNEFVGNRFHGIGKLSTIAARLHSFGKHLYGSLTKADYRTLRLGFIMRHCPGNAKFDFYKYMIRALEADFKKVVGISWYLWIFVAIFLLLNINGWNTYFWISFIPLILLLAVGTKLQHVITKLAHDVAEKNTAIRGELVVKPSDDYFWLRKPRIILYLIHLILFQNAFEVALFFWIWITYGFRSCMMGPIIFIVIRLVINVIVQVICSYSTLPLYAIVTQMGSSFKMEIFDDSVQEAITGWAKLGRKQKGPRGGNGQGASTHATAGLSERSPDPLLKNKGEIEVVNFGNAREPMFSRAVNP